ncbi:MAG: DUF4340 domain-containing protein [Gammaproteobacteria bacterium]
MSGRRVGALLVAALVIIALGLWSASRKVEIADSGAGAAVLKPLKAQLNEVTEVRIAKGDGTRATLRKQPNGWIVGEREYPADASRVRKLLIDLSALATVEAKTNDPAKYSQLGVEEVTAPTAAGTLIEAVTPEKVNGVIIGKTSGMKSGYVRATDSKQSLLATPIIQAEADPKRWLDTTLVDIPESRVKEIEVFPATGPSFRVTREKKEQSDFTVPALPKGRELQTPSAANPVATNLTLLTLTDVRKAAANGSAATQAPRATFRTFDGLEIQVTGQTEGDRRFISLVPQSTAKEAADEAQKLDARVKGWQFEIPNYKYDALFRPLEEMLLKAEPKADASRPDAKGKSPARIGAKNPPVALPRSPAN